MAPWRLVLSLDLSDVYLKKLVRVERDDGLSPIARLPRDPPESDYRSDTDFCIGGLAFSSTTG